MQLNNNKIITIKNDVYIHCWLLESADKQFRVTEKENVRQQQEER